MTAGAITRAARSAALWTCCVWIPVRLLAGGDAWPDALLFCAGWMIGALIVDGIRRLGGAR